MERERFEEGRDLELVYVLREGNSQVNQWIGPSLKLFQDLCASYAEHPANFAQVSGPNGRVGALMWCAEEYDRVGGVEDLTIRSPALISVTKRL